MEYTKEDWFVDEQECGILGTESYHIMRDEETIIAVMGKQWDDGNAEANAHLMAAAREQHELLKELADWDAGKFGKESNVKIIEISKRASKLVAKAEGN